MKWSAPSSSVENVMIEQNPSEEETIKIRPFGDLKQKIIQVYVKMILLKINLINKIECDMNVYDRLNLYSIIVKNKDSENHTCCMVLF